MEQRVVMAERPGRPRSGPAARGLGPGAGRAWRVLAVLGGALAIVGWTDVVLLWYPIRTGDPEWEFSTISSTFAGLPLATMGLALVAAAAAARGPRWVVRTVAMFCGLVCTLAVAGFGVYLLDVPLAWNAVQGPVRPALTREVVKTSVFALVYIATYGWLAWYGWRISRPEE